MKKNDTLIGITFTVWFIGTIGGLIYSASTMQTNLVAAIFGQFFLIFSLILISQKEKMGSIPLIIGTALLAGAGIYSFGSEELKNIFTGRVLGLLLGEILCIISVIFLLVIPKYNEIKKIKRCTLSVNAECIFLNKSMRVKRGVFTYSPVWKYYINGKDYTYNDDFYSNVGLPNIGDTDTLFVNPNNYNDAYRKPPFIIKAFTIFSGYGSLISTIILTYFLIFEIFNNFTTFHL